MDNFTIYKYTPLDQYALANLYDNTIYFNKAENFDDPVDCAFTIGARQPSLVLNSKLSDLYEFCNQWPRHRTDPDYDPYLHHRLLENILKDEVGIASFAEHKKCTNCGFPSLNPVMMSLYAAKHTGIVIEYKVSSKTTIHKVVYGNVYREFGFGAIIDSIQFSNEPRRVILDEQSCQPLLFKFNEWKYQQEYRIFDNPNCAVQLKSHRLSIKRIFIGSRVEIGLANSLKRLAQERKINIFNLKEPTEHNDKRRVIITNQLGNMLNCKNKCKSRSK